MRSQFRQPETYPQVKGWTAISPKALIGSQSAYLFQFSLVINYRVAQSRRIRSRGMVV